jgi:hypothetical protein
MCLIMAGTIGLFLKRSPFLSNKNHRSQANPIVSEIFAFEFSFKVSDPQEPYVLASGLSVNIGVPNHRMNSYDSLNLEFIP